MDTTPKRSLIASAALLTALLLGGCAATPDQTATLEARLDALHAADRPAWRDEMRALLRTEGRWIPEKHLALAVETFNSRADQELFLESVWRYLDARRGAGPRLATAADRRMLNLYAESALRSPGPEHRQRLERLCLTLEAEPVCASE